MRQQLRRVSVVRPPCRWEGRILRINIVDILMSTMFSDVCAGPGIGHVLYQLLDILLFLLNCIELVLLSLSLFYRWRN